MTVKVGRMDARELSKSWTDRCKKYHPKFEKISDWVYVREDRSMQYTRSVCSEMDDRRQSKTSALECYFLSHSCVVFSPGWIEQAGVAVEFLFHLGESGTQSGFPLLPFQGLCCVRLLHCHQVLPQPLTLAGQSILPLLDVTQLWVKYLQNQPPTNLGLLMVIHTLKS